MNNVVKSIVLGVLLLVLTLPVTAFLGNFLAVKVMTLIMGVN